jgi:hypothetical protein
LLTKVPTIEKGGTRSGEISAHPFELRFVALKQFSSCSVERVFLRFKLIRDTFGDNMKQDMIEFRLFIQCNDEVRDILK